jgi:SNF2 family DNA or RNA helicase
MLIFCQNLDPLMLLENMLEAWFGWAREQEFFHIDGSVTANERQSIIKRFNDLGR